MWEISFCEKKLEENSKKIKNLEEKYAYLEDIMRTIILNNENEAYKYDFDKYENEVKYNSIHSSDDDKED